MKIFNILTIQQIYEEIRAQVMPIKTAYKFNRLQAAISSDIQFYQENIDKIILEYAQFNEEGAPLTTEDGSGILIREGFEDECHQKIWELQNIDIELPQIFFSIDELDSINISPDALQVLMPFICE